MNRDFLRFSPDSDFTIAWFWLHSGRHCNGDDEEEEDEDDDDSNNNDEDDDGDSEAVDQKM